MLCVSLKYPAHFVNAFTKVFNAFSKYYCPGGDIVGARNLRAALGRHDQQQAAIFPAYKKAGCLSDLFRILSHRLLFESRSPHEFFACPAEKCDKAASDLLVGPQIAIGVTILAVKTLYSAIDLLNLYFLRRKS